MTLENKYNRGTHGDSSHMLSTVVLSNENQTCEVGKPPPLQDATEKLILHTIYSIVKSINILYFVLIYT